MTSQELRKKFIEFFTARGHKEIPSASLVPEHDPTVLFTTAGMHPLIPYLLGESHPAGSRLVNIQRCLRTDDIDEVGDATHNTFFEMLGNWSLGDPASPDGIGQGGYWKEEALFWSFEFLTKELSIPLEKLAVTVFEGDDDVPRDEESIEIWRKLGIPENRIVPRPKKDNWWGPVGETGPCGPDTEMFVWIGSGEPTGIPNEEKKWVEVWNDVFMQYNKIKEGTFEPLKQKNVDTGMGLERMLMVLQGKDSVYETDVFMPIVTRIRETGSYDTKTERIIADHLRSSIFLVSDNVEPGNKLQGYVLRRLLRRAAVKLQQTENLKLHWGALIKDVLGVVQKIYSGVYGISEKRNHIYEMLISEIDKFHKTLKSGLREVRKIDRIDGKSAFDLYQTYGFPLEITEELFKQKGQKIDHTQFEEEFRKHQELSRTSSSGMFKGGLADHSAATVRGHTATHLLHQALRDVLGDKVHQTGSNITPERVRFDFSFNRKLTGEEIEKVEKIINQKIKEDLPVRFKIMPVEEAKKIGAIGLFDEKYSDRVKVYFIGPSTLSSGPNGSGRPYSAEFCGGPHVKHTSEVGRVRIMKEEALGSGTRRIYLHISTK
ncbi:alanine--tRNA ligase [Candidatus Microgenomates bacterium]|nr:alanine--tRNA ligase [Candidatus Microgenomates bacterium]